MGADGSHNSSAPPPFLTKTYEMVDDPSTDEIVSWSENNASFVVWNVADFTKFLLPQYFKHSNFSSFVRQLNTYGFHKIDPERQEFANEGFTKGNKNALKNIHRRKPSASQTPPLQKESLTVCNDPGHAELEGEIQKLNEDKGVLINELVKVQKLQETTEAQLETLAQRIQALEERQKRIMTFFAHALCNPTFMYAANQSGSLSFSKKRRLPDHGVLIDMGESWNDEGRCLVPYTSGDREEAVSEDRGVQKSEDGSGGESSFDCVVRRLAASTLNQSEETSPLSGSTETTLWEMQSTIAEHVMTVDLVSNFVPKLFSKAAESSQVECEGVDVKADEISSHVSCGRGNAPTPEHTHDEDGTAESKVCGSNDVFWESMLTENPCLTERDSRESRCANERWFL